MGCLQMWQRQCLQSGPYTVDCSPDLTRHFVPHCTVLSEPENAVRCAHYAAKCPDLMSLQAYARCRVN